MKRALNEAAVVAISDKIFERFGSPLVELEALNEVAQCTCSRCGLMSESIDEDSCTQCGMMPETLTSDDIKLNKGEKNVDPNDASASKNDLAHASTKTEPKNDIATTAQKSSAPGIKKLNEKSPVAVDEKAPPGREKQVKALKKNKNIDNPWAVSWASYNKSHKK